MTSARENLEHFLVECPGYPPLRLESGSNLSECLTVANSSVLFGCRTGICGTCLIEVLSEQGGQIDPPDAEEVEVLELLAPSGKSARLACQIRLHANLRIRPLDEEGASADG